MLLLRETIGLAIALAWIIPANVLAAGGYFYDASGDVLVATGKSAFLPAVKEAAISPNTAVRTGGGSRAILKFDDGQIVALQANTALNIREYRFEPKNAARSRIDFLKAKGGVRFVPGLIAHSSQKSVRLDTPNGSINVQDAEFMVVMAGDVLYGKVVSGGVSMTNRAGTAKFKAGQAVYVASGNVRPASIPVEELPDGIFDELEAIVLPDTEPEQRSTEVDAENGVAAGSVNVTNSALISAAVEVAGGVVSGSVNASSASQEQGAVVGDPLMFGRHNFTPGRAGTGEICVFCHTPQGSEEKVSAPLWDRSQSQASEYKAFSSIGSATAAATGSVSIACLSCHDGTQAPNVPLNSPLNYADAGIYPPKFSPAEVSGKNYLRDHHPVSMLFGGGGVSDKQPDAPVDALSTFMNIDYDAAAIRKFTGNNDATSRDFVIRDPKRGSSSPGLYTKQDFNVAEHSGSGSGTVWWLESAGTGKGRQKSDFYLYTRTESVDGLIVNRPYVECSSCHDPHSTNPTFLRIKNVGSTVCFTCHAK